MLVAHNFAQGTVSTGYDASATSIALTSGHGARFPSSFPFRCVWWNQTDYPNPADDPNREIVEVTARSTDTLTVTRGMETSYGGLAASTKNTGGKTYGFAQVHTAGAFFAAYHPKTFAVFTAFDNRPPASNFATLDDRNGVAVLDFDDTTEEAATFENVVPENVDTSSGILARLWLMSTTATTNASRWGISIERGTTDRDADSFDTETAADVTANGTSGIPFSVDITCTTIDSIVAGDLFRVKVARKAAHANDNMTGDAELIALELRRIA